MHKNKFIIINFPPTQCPEEEDKRTSTTPQNRPKKNTKESKIPNPSLPAKRKKVKILWRTKKGIMSKSKHSINMKISDLTMTSTRTTHKPG